MSSYSSYSSSDYVEEINEGLSERAIGEFDCVLTDVQELFFDKDGIRLISENSYLLPFSANLTHSIESNADAEQMKFVGEVRGNKLEKEVQDDGSFRISEPFLNQFKGNFSINFADSDPTSWQEVKPKNLWEVSRIEEITLSLEDISLEIS